MADSEKNFISTVELASGERIGLGTVEITAVPHLTILQKQYLANTNIINEYKQRNRTVNSTSQI